MEDPIAQIAVTVATLTSRSCTVEQLVGPERRWREFIAAFRLPIVDLKSRRPVNSGVRRHGHGFHLSKDSERLNGSFAMSKSTEHNLEHDSQRLSRPLSVFISYSRSDSAFVKDLANRLREAGCTIWQDISALRGGQTWATEIDQAVRGSDLFIVVLSPDSSASQWVRKETLLAVKLHKPIVPILFRDTEIPIELFDLQFVDFREDKQEAIQKLFEAISRPIVSPTTVTRSIPFRRYIKALALFVLGAIVLGSIVYIMKFHSSPGDCFEEEFGGVNPIEAGSGIQPLREFRDGAIRIKLTDNRQPVGALSLKFYPVGEYFEIEKVIDSGCNEVEGLFNLSRQMYIDIKKDKVPNNDYIQVPLGMQNYSLRLMFQERASALFEKR